MRVAAREKGLEREQAQLRVEQHQRSFAQLSGRTAEELFADAGGVPLWRTLDAIVMRAPAAGVVVEVFVANGETVEDVEPLARIVDPSELRFRGFAPEADFARLAPGARVQIDLPGELRDVESTLIGPLLLADHRTRRVQVEAVVAVPNVVLPAGLSAIARVLVEESSADEVLVPEDCVAIDGLEAVVFRRDPNDKNVVVRTPVDLGRRGAGQVEVFSGVMVGDEVVRDGIYQLKQTGKGRTPKGGHVHADGTWHEDH